MGQSGEFSSSPEQDKDVLDFRILDSLSRYYPLEKSYAVEGCPVKELLHWGVSTERLDIVRRLLTLGAPVDGRVTMNWKANNFKIWIILDLTQLAAWLGATDMIATLLEAGAKVDGSAADFTRIYLSDHRLLRTYVHPAIDRLLYRNCKLPTLHHRPWTSANIPTRRTALQLALENKHGDVAELLTAAGARLGDTLEEWLLQTVDL